MARFCEGERLAIVHDNDQCGRTYRRCGVCLRSCRLVSWRASHLQCNLDQRPWEVVDQDNLSQGLLDNRLKVLLPRASNTSGWTHNNVDSGLLRQLVATLNLDWAINSSNYRITILRESGRPVGLMEMRQERSWFCGGWHGCYSWDVDSRLAWCVAPRLFERLRRANAKLRECPQLGASSRFHNFNLVVLPSPPSSSSTPGLQL